MSGAVSRWNGWRGRGGDDSGGEGGGVVEGIDVVSGEAFPGSE